VSAPIHFPSVQESDGPLVQETQNLGVIGSGFCHSSHITSTVSGNLLERVFFSSNSFGKLGISIPHFDLKVVTGI